MMKIKSFSLVKPYLARNRHVILIGLLCLMGVDMLQLLIPRIIKWAVDDLTLFGIDEGRLAGYALYMILAAAMTGGFRYGWRRCLMGMSRRIEEGLRNQLYHHILTLSAGYFGRVRTGDIMAHATNDIANVRMAAGMGLVALTDAVFLGSAAVFFMAYINLELTVLALLPMPLIVLCTRFFSKIMHARYRGVQRAFSDLTEIVRERFAGIRVIKAYNMRRQAFETLNAGSSRYITKNMNLVKLTGSFFPMMIFFTNISLAIVLYVGGRKTITATITPGDFVAFISYLGLMTWPMMALGWVVNLIQRGRASLERIDAIVREPAEIREVPAPVAFGDISGNGGLPGDLCFENVSFAYAHVPRGDAWPLSPEGAHPKGAPGPRNASRFSTGSRILSGINFSIRAGSIVGLTGPPGGGKTTLLNLIPRLFDVTSGRITIAGEDIRNLELKALRSNMTVVPQEPFLFSGTIRENITFRRHPSTPGEEARLLQALRDAALYDTIMSLAEGLETVVGEKGVMLSGGQKQRVALARALMKKAPLMILDDPISQVDARTGAAIIAAIRALAAHKTLLIVSHRFSALQFADRIMVLENGMITESGSHAELITADGYYARTFRLQQVEEDFNAG